MHDPGSGGSQQELHSKERRTRRKKRESNADTEENQSSKPGIRSSRDRLSFDHVQGNETAPKKDKKPRRKLNENGIEQRIPQRRAQPHRLPRSVSEEVLALEGRFNPEVPITTSDDTKQRRTRNTRGNRDRTDTDGGATTDLPPSGRRQVARGENRKKKKPRSAVFNSADEENYQGDMDGEISDFFPVDKEDIIQPSDLNHSSTRINTIMAPPTLPSQPLDVVYIEKKDGGGFVRENRSRIHRASQGRNDYAIELLQNQKQRTTLDFILTIHLLFRSLAMIGHGLLAGIAVSQCIFVYSLSGTSDRELLENYHKLALPFQSIYYFLLAFSTVSILDRYMNISSGWGPFFLRLLTKPSRALALVAYLFALIFSASLAQLDDKMSLFGKIPSLWDSSEDMDQLGTWKIINLMRVIGAFLGWIMVAIAPNDDQTASAVRDAIQNEASELDKYEMTSVHTSTVHTWDRVNNINP